MSEVKKRLRFARKLGHIWTDVENTIDKANGAYDHAAWVKSSDFLRSREWLELRYEALLRCGKMCMCCCARPGHLNPLHVDHIKPRWKYPELALDINNLQVLCMQCNFGKSGWDQTDHRGAA